VKAVAEKRRALRELIRADSPKEDAIRKAADELGKAAGDAAVVMVKTRSQVRELLTDDQRKKLEKLEEYRKALQDWFKERPKFEAEG